MEIYISDYDGERQQRVTVGKTLNVFPRWSPNGRSIAYTSYRRGSPNIFVSNIYEATMEEVTKGTDENWLAAWSPDGSKFCFASPREGQGYTNLYVVNRDGSGLTEADRSTRASTPRRRGRRQGAQIAFVSGPDRQPADLRDRRRRRRPGAADQTAEGYAPTSRRGRPLPYNEIAYTARTGPGNDIKVIDMATEQ